MWVDRDDELRAKLGCILSIGAGINAADNALKHFAETLKLMASESERIETLFSRTWNQGNKYYRFNLPTPAHVGLEEKLKIASYLENGDRKIMMEDCAKNMVGDGNYFPEIRKYVLTTVLYDVPKKTTDGPKKRFPNQQWPRKLLGCVESTLGTCAQGIQTSRKFT
jgi:hypothetical protein